MSQHNCPHSGLNCTRNCLPFGLCEIEVNNGAAAARIVEAQQKRDEQREAGPERVDHPLHYGGGENPYETIKVLEAWLSEEELIGFLKGTAIKYLSRAGKHVAGDPALQDAKKGRWYVDRLITHLERRKP